MNGSYRGYAMVFGRIVIALIVLFAAGNAAAVRFDYVAELGFLHSDNINLDENDPISENVVIPSFGFTLTESGSAVQAQASGLFQYRNYLGNEFSDETRTTLDARVNWSIIPERLAWTFADNLGVNPIDLRQPVSPDNVQRTNVFSTGPTFRFRLTPTLEGQAELRYVDTYAEINSEFDSQRLGGALRALYDLGPTRRISGNVEVDDVDFDSNLLSTDYRRTSAFVGYTEQLARFDLDLSAGYSYIDFDDGESSDGPLARASLDWRSTGRTTFGLGLFWQLSDAAASLASGTAAFDTGIGDVPVGSDLITADVFEERRIDARHAYLGVRWTATTGAFVNRIRYERDSAFGQDRDEFGTSFNLDYRLRQTLGIGVLAALTRRDFTNDAGNTRDTLLGTYLRQQMTRHWSWRVDLTHTERSSDADLGYDENSAYLRVSYIR